MSLIRARSCIEEINCQTYLNSRLQIRPRFSKPCEEFFSQLLALVRNKYNPWDCRAAHDFLECFLMKCSIKSSSLISSQPSGLLAGPSPGIRQEPNFPFPNEEVTPDSQFPTLVPRPKEEQLHHKNLTILFPRV